MSENNYQRSLIFGCGDVGRRIAKLLLAAKIPAASLSAYVNSQQSADLAVAMGVQCQQLDLDALSENLDACDSVELYYTVAPQKYGLGDERSRSVIKEFLDNNIKPRKVVLISTTGVYGDCDGEWVSELSPTRPQTERGQRRLDSEAQWLQWGRCEGIDVVVLRVPGIYAFSRLPRQRLQAKTPVVHASECGFTNRIHADDLANICVAAMRKGPGGEIYNATDGSPGKISEYLQAAAQVLNLDALPEISMSQARDELSSGMLSYLNESRKISNQKMLDELGVKLFYADFKQGILH